jgi:hypothetical protein
MKDDDMKIVARNNKYVRYYSTIKKWELASHMKTKTKFIYNRNTLEKQSFDYH